MSCDLIGKASGMDELGHDLSQCTFAVEDDQHGTRITTGCGRRWFFANDRPLGLKEQELFDQLIKLAYESWGLNLL